LKTNLTQNQKENIQIDFGIAYTNFGVAGEKQIAPTKGGGAFTVKEKIREIEFDGKKGKTKGLQVVEEVEAVLKITIMDMSLDTLNMALRSANYSAGIITGVQPDDVIPIEDYLTNVTLFCKTLGGQFKKITLFNAMSENGLAFKATAKGEGEIELEIYAHFDPLDQTQALYEIKDVASINPAADIKVTGVTIPATAVVAVGAKITITPTIAPVTATNKRVAWATATPAKATVTQEGIVTGVAAGTSVISCISLDGGIIATCTVTVS